MSNETDLDWLARNVHEWPAGEHQPWCYVYMTYGGVMKAAGNFLDAVANPAMITIDQWISRRAELQNKPSWKDAPEWACCIVQDKLGNWYFCSDTPNLEFDKWGDEYVRKCLIYSGGVVIGDWRETLEKRPEESKQSIEEANRLTQEFKSFTSIEDNQEQEMKQDNGWFERGELPPVGVVCIFEPGSGSCYFNEYDLKASGKIVKIIAHTRYEHSSCDVAVFRWDLDGCFGVSTGNTQSFRPIRTERDVLIEIIKNADDTDDKIADAILAAGFSRRDK